MQEQTSPEWGDVKAAIRRANGLLGRSSLYVAISEGRIRSTVIKTRRDNVRGRRAIYLPSVDAFISGGGAA